MKEVKEVKDVCLGKYNSLAPIVWTIVFNFFNFQTSLTSQNYYLSSRMFIISTAALATDVPGPKMAATPA